MGDYLSELFIHHIAAAPPDRYPTIRLIGSVISDFIIRQDLARSTGNPNAVVGYWGCGLRDEHAIDVELRARCRFHGVRGPLTRERLGLPDDTPLGDPALLLPLLHTPGKRSTMTGRSICMPHINDTASNHMLVLRTGVDDVVRSAIPGSMEALLETLDAICTADFVLAGALHAAIVACAYGRPFAFYADGLIDLPFKWFDFAASVNVPAVFVRNLVEGRRAWDTLLMPTLHRPKLVPILTAFPGELLPGLLEKAKAFDTHAEKRQELTQSPFTNN